MSGLRLNLPKTWLIPLWHTIPSRVKRTLRDDYPSLAAVGVTLVSKYLGALLGPGSLEPFWQEARSKFLKVCSRWSQGPCGLTLAATIYNTYCLSTLSFLAQFRGPDALTLQAEKKGLAMFSKGPGNWVTPKELFHLHDWFGFRVAFKSVAHTSLAARLRVSRYEKVSPSAEVRTLALALADANHRVPSWCDWCDSSFQHSL